MRTEDDLRAAFGSLEGQVADGARILAGAARESRRRTVRRRAGGVLAAAAVSATAVVALAQVPVQPHGQPTAAAVRVKLLAAWVAPGNDILVSRISSPGGGPSHAVEMTVDEWDYPWAASPGHQAQHRMLISEHGKPASDIGGSYTVPKPGTESMSGRGINVDYSSRAWSYVKMGLIGGPLCPVDLKSQIAAGTWTVSGPTEFRGHQALKLTGTLTAHTTTGQIAQEIIELWVDASTYLPLHEYSTTSGVNAAPPITTDFELLPPTAANLALLNPVIPPGFRQLPGVNPTAAPQPKLP